MKFTIEVSDFYLDEGELSSELKHYIKREVVGEIWTKVRDEVKNLMEGALKEEINKELSIRVKTLIDEFIKNGKVRGRYSSDPDRSVSEWIAESIRTDHKTLGEIIKRQVDVSANELKQRYDLLFATQLITKIKEQGFLKEEAAKLLLTDEPSNG